MGIKELVEQDIKNQVDKFLKGEIEHCFFPCAYPQIINDYLDSIGGKNLKDTLDINGWQWDYRYQYEINGTEYTISGCGYWGGTYITSD